MWVSFTAYSTQVLHPGDGKSPPVAHAGRAQSFNVRKQATLAQSCTGSGFFRAKCLQEIHAISTAEYNP
ncbi:hypothetical protein DCC81_10330 [Chitinophaga parva]|uniref:Uncharacterized protein n=1 Tax=Chitinophaga parva TaxID=2169414 RepID=A0A2T7BEK9_9BACT|nr:hypothetical protein DCC81_10330 [Chitinophaga parva]